ncbi:MAG TPA: nucleotidyltransferase family protein, partial [Dehalococcoidia bacterium]|nr:nucleotidyltransferase family protein [Dehalococcoidia bacterium]
AILLAAGQSKRMGKPKLPMSFGRSTIIEQAVDNLLGSAADEVIVVLGDRAGAVKRLIAGRSVKLVVNPDYERGMSTSIVAGLNLVDRRTRAVMLALGDQPLIDSQTINRLIAGFRSHDKGIAVPTYRGDRGHPVIFSMKYKEPLLALKGDVGARQIIQENPGDILEVAVDCEGIQIDIDTADCYYLESNRLG